MASRNTTPRRMGMPAARTRHWLMATALLAGVQAPPALAVGKSIACEVTNWVSASCWSPAGVPGAADNVHAGPVSGAAATLTIAAGTTAAASTLDVDSTSGVLAQINVLGGSLTLGGSYKVGFSGNGVASQTGGTLSAADLQIGPYAGSSGSYTFSGAATAMSVNQLFVGLRGNGSLVMSSGTATVGSNLIVGYFDTAASASVLQTGGTLSTPSSYIGVDGNASFEQTAGAHTVSGSLYLGYGPGGHGSYTLSGGTLSSANAFVGRAGSASIVQNGGSVSTGLLLLAQQAGSSGSYTLNGGTLTVDSITAGGGSSGFYWSGGVLDYNSTLIIGAGGPLGSNLSLGSAKTLYASGLQNEASATVTLNGGRMEVAALSNRGRLSVMAGGITLGSSADNSGTLVMGGGAISGAGSLSNSGAVTGSGSIQIAGQFSNAGLLRTEGGTLTLQANAGIANTGLIELPAGTRLALLTAWSNDGQLQMDGGTLSVGTLTNTASGLIAGSGRIESAVVNQGQLTVAAGALVLGSSLNNSGIVQLTGLGSQLAGSGTLTNTGTVQGTGNVGMLVSNSGTLEAVGGTLSFSALANTNAASGALLAGSGGKLLMTRGLATNAGLIQLEGGSFDNGGARLANTGRIIGQGSLRAGTVSNSGQISFSFGASHISAPISNQTGARLIISNGAQATFADAVTNAGELRTSAGGAANFFGLVSGGGSFTGTGQTRFEAGFSPGFSPAVVTVDPQVFIGSASTVTMELGGTTPGECDACHDKVVFNGAVTLEGGPLAVVWWNGYQGQAGDRFDLFDWHGGLSGRFGSLQLPALASGLAWQTDALYTEGVLGVAAVPEPGAWALMLLGGAGLLAWRRRAGDQGAQAAAGAARG